MLEAIAYTAVILAALLFAALVALGMAYNAARVEIDGYERRALAAARQRRLP